MKRKEMKTLPAVDRPNAGNAAHSSQDEKKDKEEDEEEEEEEEEEVDLCAMKQIFYAMGMIYDIMTNGIIRFFTLAEQCHTQVFKVGF